MSVNKVILIGNFGKDPELKCLPNGNAVCNVSLATSEDWLDKNTNEKKTKTQWHNLTFYRKQAETIAKFLKKGSKLYIEGKLDYRKWEKDGVTRYTTDIIVTSFDMQGDKSSGAGGNSKPQRTATTQKVIPVATDSFDDDIPF